MTSSNLFIMKLLECLTNLQYHEHKYYFFSIPVFVISEFAHRSCFMNVNSGEYLNLMTDTQGEISIILYCNTLME